MAERVRQACFICGKETEPPVSISANTVWTCSDECQRWLDRKIVDVYERQEYTSVQDAYDGVQEYFGAYDWSDRTTQRRVQAALGRLGKPNGEATIKSRKRKGNHPDDLV